MNNDALLSYLSFLAPTPPHTFFQGIKKLAAGEYLTLREGKVDISRYYDLLEAKPSRITDKNEAVEKLEELLEESISLRLCSDAPMAALLSGGIEKYDERKNAKESAVLLGISNRAIEIDQTSFIDAIEPVFDALDEPLNDPAAVPLYLLFYAIKEDGYKVVISGEGSDELFLGYRQYFEYLDIENFSCELL